MLRRPLVWILVALTVSIGFWLWRQRSEKPAEKPRLANVASAERRDLDVIAEAAGKIEPVRVVEVKSNAGGEVLSVLVETGDTVPKGALLAEVNPRDVQSSLDQTNADLESARVRLATAEAEQRRSERLAEAGLLPTQEVERTVEATAAARANLVRAETAQRLASEKREDVAIRSPSAGTILARSVEPGQIIASATTNVGGGTALFRMADLSQVQVRASIDEVDIGRIRPGQEARVTVESYPGRSFVGTVAKIEPQAVVEQNVTLFPVLVVLDNREGLLRPGMTTEVSFEIVHREGVVAVPNGAIVNPRELRAAATALGLDPAAVRGEAAPEASTNGREDHRGKTEEGSRPGLVFVQGPNGPEARSVLLGVTDWEFTEVLSGLAEGEPVVLLSVVRLERQQQEMNQRMQQRMGSPLGTSNRGTSGGSSSGGARGGRGN
jgi:HlyD family secretion protein